MYLDPRKLNLGKPVDEKVLTAKRPPRHRPGSEFLCGPIPLAWLCRATLLPGKALAIGLALWFKAGATKNRTVKLTGALADRFNVGRKASARCLKALEAAGLVTVARHVGRARILPGQHGKIGDGGGAGQACNRRLHGPTAGEAPFHVRKLPGGQHLGHHVRPSTVNQYEDAKLGVRYGGVDISPF